MNHTYRFFFCSAFLSCRTSSLRVCWCIVSDDVPLREQPKVYPMMYLLMGTAYKTSAYNIQQNV